MMPSNNTFFQVCWIVNDIDAAMRRWVESARVGPFYVNRHIKVDGYRHRGRPVAIDFSGALAQAGMLQIELIQQHSDTPSAYRDSFAPGQEGFHHICRFVTDYEAEVQRYRGLGLEPAAEGVFGDMRFAYIDTRTTIDCMTEIIEDRPSIRAYFKTVSDAAIDWDGRDPIRDV
jgi:Glyoxalase/Bleomycin resistance protein/Dioxygenase superfamily